MLSRSSLPRRPASAARQSGAVILTTALLLLFLLGFMGIAVDFGRLFVVKSEMQTAMDSCALAAAQELDGGPDALSRATSAGKTAGNANKIQFQGEAAGLLDADVTFSDALDGTYSSTFAPVANATYAKCTHTRTGLAPWLLQALSGFTGDPKYQATNGVFALGVATLTPAQTACPLPVRIRPRNTTPPDFGFKKGDWISTVYKDSGPNEDTEPGHFGWANLNPDNPSSAETIRDQLRGTGSCIKTDAAIAATGMKFSAAEEWNSRFGLYKSSKPDAKISITNAPPDLTGYSYYPDTMGGQTPIDTDVLPDFLDRRASNRSYGDTVDTVKAGDNLTGLKIKGGYGDGDMGTYAAGPRALSTHGANRRLVLAPVMSATEGKVDGWACVLMLHPIDGPNTTVYLEYVGNASNASSPCASSGLAGGTTGPLVPVLVE